MLTSWRGTKVTVGVAAAEPIPVPHVPSTRENGAAHAYEQGARTRVRVLDIASKNHFVTETHEEINNLLDARRVHDG